ncbi:MAG TPA: glycosyltransferase, partial [Solirubrobacteraceae bacterium]
MACFLFVSYSGLLGGAERVLLDIASDVDGTALIACPPGPLAEAARQAGVTAVELPVRDLRARGGLRRAATAMAALAGHGLDMRRLQRELDPSLVVAWGMRSGIGALALPPGFPFLFAHHDFLPSPGVAAVIRRVARRARAVVVPSEAVRFDLDPGRHLSDRIQVIPPGVDVDRFAAVEPALDDQSVLLLGAVAPWKRPDLGLDIVALARQELPRVTLRIVGAPVTEDEPFLQELQQRAASPELAPLVTLRGAVSDPRLELEHAACLLHCAPAEPFGMVIVEALAAGLPVVVPDAAGPREIVDAECGELYSPGDAASAAQALIRVLGDPGRARAMGRAGRARARARFTVTQTRQRFADALSAAHRPPSLTPQSSPQEITLVTVSHNSSHEVRQLIACRDRYLPGTPMIIVDCASSDQSATVAEGRADIRMIALDENIGFGRACNRGLREVRTPVTALVNPDVELVDRSLLALAHEALRDDRPERLLA